MPGRDRRGARLAQLEPRSDALTHAIDDFLLDLMTACSLLNATDAALNCWRERLPVEGWQRSDFCREGSMPPMTNDIKSLMAEVAITPHSAQ
ncbi:MAG: hypothetical protein E5Y29_00145 [Mesorhizobium sp.]|nr:MAG: hypothetical protein E5Y29_00145 [Mesorhizobium sp.]